MAYSREMVDKFASAVENAELRHEFGRRRGGRRAGGRAADPEVRRWRLDELTRGTSSRRNALTRGRSTRTRRGAPRARGPDAREAVARVAVAGRKLARMVAGPGVEAHALQVRTCSEMLDELVVAYNGVGDRQVAAAAAVLPAAQDLPELLRLHAALRDRARRRRVDAEASPSSAPSRAAALEVAQLMVHDGLARQFGAWRRNAPAAAAGRDRAAGAAGPRVPPAASG